MSLRKLENQKVKIRTTTATLRDIKGTIVTVSDNIVELRDNKGNIIFIPLTSCGLIKVINDKNAIFKESKQ